MIIPTCFALAVTSSMVASNPIKHDLATPDLVDKLSRSMAIWPYHRMAAFAVEDGLPADLRQDDQLTSFRKKRSDPLDLENRVEDGTRKLHTNFSQYSVNVFVLI